MRLLARLRRAATQPAQALAAMRDEDALAMLQSIGLRRGAQLAALQLREPVPQPGECLPWQRATLDAILARLCREEGSDDVADALPSPQSVGACEATLDFAGALPPDLAQQLYDLLVIFEIGVTALGPQRQRRRFTRLDAEAQDVYLRSWEQSALLPRRTAFHSLKAACMMGYWTRPAVWTHIGYTLDTELLRDAEEPATR